MLKNHLTILALAAGLVASCSRKPGQTVAPSPETTREKPLVYTTFYPTAYFTERIAGETVDVICPVPPDADPIFWVPDDQTISAYQSADLIILNGAGFAKWVANVSLPESRVTDTARALAGQLITYENTTTHSHGKTGTHSHRGTDGHTWLDPVNAKAQAAEIRDALTKHFPPQEKKFRGGYTALATDLDTLDARLKGYQSSSKNPPLLASHPAYNYLARRYGWNLKNLDLDPETPLSDRQLTEIQQILATHPASHLLWESAPLTETAETLRTSLGLSSIVFSPCEIEGPANYLETMQKNLDAIRIIFE